MKEFKLQVLTFWARGRLDPKPLVDAAVDSNAEANADENNDRLQNLKRVGIYFFCFSFPCLTAFCEVCGHPNPVQTLNSCRNKFQHSFALSGCRTTWLSLLLPTGVDWKIGRAHWRDCCLSWACLPGSYCWQWRRVMQKLHSSQREAALGCRNDLSGPAFQQRRFKSSHMDMWQVSSERWLQFFP